MAKPILEQLQSTGEIVVFLVVEVVDIFKVTVERVKETLKGEEKKTS